MAETAMIRKQVYITRSQEEALAERARLSGRSQSDLIREAIDLITEEQQRAVQRQVVRRVAGLWKNRKDLPDVEELRRESDSRLGRMDDDQ
jgi:hypothetical protein